MQSILIVEDEKPLAELLRDYLVKDNFKVDVRYDGAQIIDVVKHQYFDLIILDVMLPYKDGMNLCREIRQIDQHMPIIMTTAKVEEIDRLLGLELGADDYICKPYSPREVVARVKAVLRRSHNEDSKQATQEFIKIDEDAMSITLNQHLLELTVVEFQLLKTMLNRPNKVFSRQELMSCIYNDYRVVSDRTIDSHIKKLRKKIQAVPNLQSQDIICSVYGAGYRFEYPDS